MGKVWVLYNIMPEGADTPMEAIVEAIPNIMPENVRVETVEIKPIAFGLRMVVAALLMDDAEGIVENVERALGSIEGVQNVEVKDQTLI